MKKGFVLLETIVVISVVCVTLVLLYSGYANIIKLTKSQNTYDNPEYLYKTYLINDYLKDIINENTNVYCTDSVSGKSCRKVTESDAYLNSLVTAMRVKAIYITKWDVSTLYNDEANDYRGISMYEATTQRYIKQLNPVVTEENSDDYRIIVMYEDENKFDDLNSYGVKEYQYASLKFISTVQYENNDV